MADKDEAPEKPRVIPSVPPTDRERLNEGFERPTNPPQPQPKPTTKEE